MSRRLLLLIALWWAACWFLYAHVPPSPDDTDIDYMGWMVLRGGVQYVDFIDMNWPGGVWLHALATKLFGVNLMSWRILDFAIAIAAMVTLIGLVSRAYGRTAALWLAFLYPAIYVTLGIWMAGQRDAVAGHGLAIALGFHVRAWERQQLRWQVIVGLVLGMAILVKPTIGFAGPLLVLHGCIWSFQGSGAIRGLQHGAVAGASASAVLVLGLGALLLQGAPLENVLEGGYLLNRLAHNIAKVEDRNVFIGMKNVTVVILHWVTLLAFVGLALIATDRTRTVANKLLLVVPVLAGLVNYWVQRKFFEYHLAVIVPGLVALACVALGEATMRVRSGAIASRLAAGIAIALAVVGTSVKIAKLGAPVIGYRIGAMDRTEYYGRFRPFQIDYGRLLTLSERIAKQVPENGTVLVWGSENAINYLAERPQPTRFHHWVALSYAKKPLPMADKWNQWFERDLTDKRPEMALIGQVSMRVSASRGAPNHFFLERFLREGYTLVETIDEMDIYVRRQLPEGGEPPVERTEFRGP
jgi:hypothetical protein